MNSTSTETVVRRALQGDKSSFAALYDRFAPAVRAVCWGKLGRVHDAQDLTQEAFLRAFRKLGELNDRSRFGPWVLAIARNACLEWNRIERRWNSHCERSPSRPSTPPSPSEEEFESLHIALRKLKDDERTALELFYLMEYDAEFTREILELSRSGFYKLLERARRSLKEQLEIYNVEKTGRLIW